MCSSHLISSEICDKNWLVLIQSSARMIHNSPSSITYPAISNVLIKSLCQKNAIVHSSHLIGSEIHDEKGLG